MWSVEKVGAASNSGMATSIPVYPELRRFYPELRAAPVFSRLVSHPDRAHTVSLPANCAKLNRQTPEVEHLATRTKQTPAICSNRQKFQFRLGETSTPLSSVGARGHARILGPARFSGARSLRLPAQSICEGEWFRGAVPADAQASNPPRSRNLTPRSFYHRLSQFLPGSGLQVETAVTHSKQSIGAFLPGSRFAHMRTVTPQGAYVRLASNSMPARGKFIVLEGIDGSGKRTQLDMLARAFASRNVPFAQISFPRYDRFFGKLAGCPTLPRGTGLRSKHD
jgi:hypothetical protein